MEQKNEQSVYEVMTKYAGEVIAEMAGEIFTTRNFIEAFADKHEIIYVELLFAAYKNDRRVYFIGFIPKSERICPRIRRNST